MKSLLKFTIIFFCILIVTGLLSVGAGYWLAKQKTEELSRNSIDYPISSDQRKKLDNLTQAFEQNEIEKKKRSGQFLYTSGNKVFYRWGLVKLDSVRIKDAQFMCFADIQNFPETQRIDASNSFIDITQIYKLLEAGYRYDNTSPLDYVGKIEAKVNKLSKMLLVLDELDKPILVLFFDCRT